MRFDDLSEQLQGKLLPLKHASGTIEHDVRGCLEDANGEEEFRTNALARLACLVAECEGWKQLLSGQGAPVAVCRKCNNVMSWAGERSKQYWHEFTYKCWCGWQQTLRTSFDQDGEKESECWFFGARGTEGSVTGAETCL